MKIKIIKRAGKSVLVEWFDETFQRGYVPKEDIHSTQVSRDNLEKAIPYGDDFTDLKLEWPDHAQLVEALHGVGIWTKEDIKANMSTLRGVINRIVRALVTQLRDYAKEK